jgi:hypothetical protein
MAKPDKTRQRQQLTVVQKNAVDLLIQGKSDRQVAELVDVSRQTVCEWRQRHSGFIGELNLRRQEVWGAQTERLRGLVETAVDALEAALRDEGSLSAAVHVLKAAGVNGTDLRPLGPIEPTEIERQIDHEAQLAHDRAEDEEIRCAEARQARVLRRTSICF